ncbi:MAG TPA: hypothetical protein VGC36_13800 [Rhizomicrobium sp.]
MNDPSRDKGGFSRRAVTVGGGIAAALGLAAIGVSVPRLFGKHYEKTPYDDLLGKLIDRETAARLGHGADAPADVKTLAATLRQRLDHRTLAQATQSDVAAGRLAEVKGWVLPQTLTQLCVLAAAVES